MKTHPQFNEFNSPPAFSEEERKTAFVLPNELKDKLKKFSSYPSMVGFCVQYFYFVRTQRFFSVKEFVPEDKFYIAEKVLQIPNEILDEKSYPQKIKRDHKDFILEYEGYVEFDDLWKEKLSAYTLEITKDHLDETKLIKYAVVHLREKKVTIPKLYRINRIVRDARNKRLEDTYNLFSSELTKDHFNHLQKIFEKPAPTETDNNDVKKGRYNKHLFTLLEFDLKKTTLDKDEENLKVLKEYNSNFCDPIDKLQLAPEIIRYYAEQAKNQSVHNLSTGKDPKKYLQIACFLREAYYQLNDHCSKKIHEVAKSGLRKARKSKNTAVQEAVETDSSLIDSMLDDHQSITCKIELLRNIIQSKELDDHAFRNEVVSQFLQLFPDQPDSIIEIDTASIIKDSPIINHDEIFYKTLNDFQPNKIRQYIDIICCLEFDPTSTNTALLDAIEFLRENRNSHYVGCPLNFLDKKDLQYTKKYIANGNYNLYRFMIVSKVSDSLKNRSLTLSYSYESLPYEKRLIPSEEFHGNKNTYLNMASLGKWENGEKILSELGQRLSEQYEITNKRIASGDNIYSKMNDKGRIAVETPAIMNPGFKLLSSYFPQDRKITMYEAASTINNEISYTSLITHPDGSASKDAPSVKSILGAIIGLGTGHNIYDFSHITANIDQGELIKVGDRFLTLDILKEMNWKIVNFIEELKIHKIYYDEYEEKIIGSDGSHLTAPPNLLGTNDNYKYNNKPKGVVIHCNVDQLYRIVAQKIMPANEREAHSSADLYLENEEVKVDLHATDTHGYTEIIFGLMHMLDIMFVPRIKGLADIAYYCVDPRTNYTDKGYHIIPTQAVNSDLILENWDDVLRFMTTLKLRKASATELLKHFAALEKQTPLVKALKHFGRIIKSFNCLQIVDSVTLRQQIQKQLNIVENMNRMRRKVRHANGNEMVFLDKRRQLISDQCTCVLQNCLIAWNYMHLLEHCLNLQHDQLELAELCGKIQASNMSYYSHFNFRGEYDFSVAQLKNCIKLDWDKVQKFELPENIKRPG